MQRTRSTAYLVGRLVPDDGGGTAPRGEGGEPVCLVEQGARSVRLHPGAAEGLRCLAGGVAVAEFCDQLGDDADCLLGYLVDVGLVVVDPAGDPGALDRLRLDAELTDLGPAGDDPDRRLVRGAGGVLLTVSCSTRLVVRRAMSGTLGSAVRDLARACACGAPQEVLLAALADDLRDVLALGAARLVWTGPPAGGPGIPAPR